MHVRMGISTFNTEFLLEKKNSGCLSKGHLMKGNTVYGILAIKLKKDSYKKTKSFF